MDDGQGLFASVTTELVDGVAPTTLRSLLAAKEQLLRATHEPEHTADASPGTSPRPLRQTGQVTAARAASPRRGRPGYDVETLLGVAVEVFNERGYDGTSMDDLSKRLGIAKSAIYHHVSGKEELLRLSLDRALDGLFAVANAVRDSDAPAIARLEQLVRGSVEVLQRELPHVTLLLRVRGNTRTEREALERRRKFDRYVAGLVRQASRDGDLSSELDPTMTAHLLFGLVNSMVEWYRPGRKSRDTALADAVVAIAFDGLRVP